MNPSKNTNDEKADEKRLEDAIAQFVIDYKRDRARFWSLFVNDNRKAIRAGTKFREWDAGHVISAEMTMTRLRLQKLEDAIRESGLATGETISLIALTAKNRVEVISERSDFYPVYSALLALGLTTVAYGMEDSPLKYLAALGALFFASISALLRATSREQVAYLKELAHMADHLAKHATPTRKQNETPPL